MPLDGHRTTVERDAEDTVLIDMASLCADDAGSVVADRYVLLGVLGSGGAAVVHEALDTRLDRRVALKLLRDGTSHAHERHRFVSEARLLGRLAPHRHLVQVLDAGFQGDRPYLVLELVRGGTLGERIAEGMPPERLASVGADLAEALAHVHAAGVIHRDVKPGNVLVAEDGTVKLADFGIARLVDDPRRHTRTGQVIGTVAYLAPEQVAGEPATTAVDVYSLGLVLLEALTGAPAYTGTSVESALARLSRPPEVPESLPAGWPALLRSMTARDPGARPAADQVAARLREIASGAPVLTAPRKGVPAGVVLAGLAAAFVLLLGVAAAPALPGLPPSDSSATASRILQGGVADRLHPRAGPATPAPDARIAPAAATVPAPQASAPAAPHHRAGHHQAARHHHAKRKHHGGHHRAGHHHRHGPHRH